MFLRLLLLLVLFPSTLMAQNAKPLIATDNSTQTCNATRMVFSPGSLACSGSVATVSGGSSGVSSVNAQQGGVGVGTFTTLNVNTNMTGSVSNNVFTINSSGSGGSSQWLTAPSQGIGTTDPVGIGTTIPSSGQLIVTGGNVGIGTIRPGKTLDITGDIRASGHETFEGVASTGATGTGKFVFDGTPTLVTPVIGAATGTSVSLSGNVGINGAGLANNLGIVAAADSGIIMTGVGDMYAQFNQPSNTAKDTHMTVGSTDIVSVGSTHTVNLGPIIVTGFITRYNNPNNVIFSAGNAGGGAAREQIFFDNNGADTMILNDQNNVGIGTAMPVSLTPTIPNKLYVNGTGEMSGFKLNTGAAAGNVLVSNTVGVGTWMAASTIPVSAGSAAGGTNAVQYNSGSSTFAGNESKFSFNGTNVGIGTTNGLFALFDVWGDESTSGNLGLGTNSVSGGKLVVWGGNVGIGTNITSNAGLSIMNGNVGIGTWKPEGKFVLQGGNVGIGSLTPGQILDVNGTIRASGSGNNILTANVGIGSSTPGSSLDIAGNVRLSTGGFLISQQPTAPTVATNDCGTTGQGTVAANSSDLLGTATVGTLAVTSCAVTFNKTHGTAPICLCQDDTNVLAVRCTATTTKLTITSATSMSSDVVAYWCPTNLP